MSYFCPEVLAGYANIPHFIPRDLYSLPLTPIAKGCAKGFGSDMSSPIEDALQFYALNHLVALIRNEYTSHQKLPVWAQLVMQAYMDCVIEQSTRMFKYVLLIVTREARHAQNDKEDPLWKAFIKKYGKIAHDFNWKTRNKGTIGTAQYLIDNPPDITLGTWVDACEHLFRKDNGFKFSGGYGGDPWADIALALLRLVRGESTMETFLDTAYTLAHNGGPIFNKEMFYHHYGDQMMVYRVLDVQNSGQMPEFLLYEHKKPSEKLQQVIFHIKAVKANLPDAFGGYVDWFKVDALAAAHTKKGYKMDYSAEKKKQAALFGGSEKTEKGDKIIGKWEVYPGQTINIIERKLAA